MNASYSYNMAPPPHGIILLKGQQIGIWQNGDKSDLSTKLTLKESSKQIVGTTGTYDIRAQNEM